MAIDRKIAYDIILCARHSYVGEMIYRKYNRSHTNYENERKQVVPLSVGRTSTGKEVLFAEDYRDGHQVKMFVLDGIVRFRATKREVRTSFPIELKKIFNRLAGGISEDDFDDCRKSASMTGMARRIVARIMQFSGAEANLYRDDGSDASDYESVD